MAAVSFRNRIGHDLAGLGIEPAQGRIAEIGEIDAAVRIAHHVVGLIGRLGQLVGRDDGTAGVPAHALERLEFIGEAVRRAQIDGREIFCEALQPLGLLHEETGRFAGAQLRGERDRVLGIAQHARDDLDPLLGRVGRARDPL